ncbi:SDR family oxidoreductase [Arthrobacter burdickii]|uniref:SDR family oxidoreductase n=1 Tax=Arthrobacter burdickii TaxID=3035920 RepID=A0ABT8JY86_9MICC|nr:SDR family oxidoreductase [Arthrobacter burdickii]MDN4610134.1 SDR family oxidoreductase [Arthrobacter burdickii]
MEQRIAVTGSTGTVGGQVARILAAEGVPLILPVRSPDRAQHLPESIVRQTTYADFDASAEALAGVDLLFMVSAAEEADRVATHRTFIDAAKEAGVRHIVYTSFLGAAPDATFLLGRDHWYTEEHIRRSGMSWTFLRDNLYLDVVPALAEDGVIRGPAGNGLLSAVAQADVARSAAAVLRAPDAHVGTAYHLTGPEAFTLAEAAALITELTPATVRFEDETYEEALASRAHHGAPRWLVEAWVSTYTAIARGEMAGVTPDVERLTGRRPLSLRDLLTAKS